MLNAFAIINQAISWMVGNLEVDFWLARHPGAIFNRGTPRRHTAGWLESKVVATTLLLGTQHY